MDILEYKCSRGTSTDSSPSSSCADVPPVGVESPSSTSSSLSVAALSPLLESAGVSSPALGVCSEVTSVGAGSGSLDVVEGFVWDGFRLIFSEVPSKSLIKSLSSFDPPL